MCFFGIMRSEPNYAILHPRIIPKALNVSFSKTIDSFQTHISIDLISQLSVVTNSNLPGLRFFVCCICIRTWHSHLNDKEFLKQNVLFPKGLYWVQH